MASPLYTNASLYPPSPDDGQPGQVRSHDDGSVEQYVNGQWMTIAAPQQKQPSFLDPLPAAKDYLSTWDQSALGRVFTAHPSHPLADAIRGQPGGESFGALDDEDLEREWQKYHGPEPTTWVGGLAQQVGKSLAEGLAAHPVLNVTAGNMVGGPFGAGAAAAGTDIAQKAVSDYGTSTPSVEEFAQRMRDAGTGEAPAPTLGGVVKDVTVGTAVPALTEAGLDKLSTLAPQITPLMKSLGIRGLGAYEGYRYGGVPGAVAGGFAPEIAGTLLPRSILGRWLSGTLQTAAEDAEPTIAGYTRYGSTAAPAEEAAAGMPPKPAGFTPRGTEVPGSSYPEPAAPSDHWYGAPKTAAASPTTAPGEAMPVFRGTTSEGLKEQPLWQQQESLPTQGTSPVVTRGAGPLATGREDAAGTAALGGSTSSPKDLADQVKQLLRDQQMEKQAMKYAGTWPTTSEAVADAAAGKERVPGDMSQVFDRPLGVEPMSVGGQKVSPSSPLYGQLMSLLKPPPSTSMIPSDAGLPPVTPESVAAAKLAAQQELDAHAAANAMPVGRGPSPGVMANTRGLPARDIPPQQASAQVPAQEDEIPPFHAPAAPASFYRTPAGAAGKGYRLAKGTPGEDIAHKGALQEWFAQAMHNKASQAPAPTESNWYQNTSDLVDAATELKRQGKPLTPDTLSALAKLLGTE